MAIATVIPIAREKKVSVINILFIKKNYILDLKILD